MQNIFVWLLPTFLLTIALPAEAQNKSKPFRVGVLTPAERQWESVAFRDELRDLGYIEGSNVLIDVRSARDTIEESTSGRRARYISRLEH